VFHSSKTSLIEENDGKETSSVETQLHTRNYIIKFLLHDTVN